MTDWQDKKVLVTGDQGFLGKHIIRHLQELGLKQGVNIRTFDSVNLCDVREVEAWFSRSPRFDCVFHLAGHNGGIEFNRKRPADIFHHNTVMGLNLLRSCQEHGVGKVVSIVASCAYPQEKWADPGEWNDFRKLPLEIMEEGDFLDGPPHDSVACHGYAKRNLQLASQFFRQQYGLQAVCVCPTTLYGPGDSLDPERTKVLGGMVRRFVEAKRDRLPHVTCWGSGIAQREFLYVEDAAKLIAQAALVYDDSGCPLNLGTGQEHTIRDMAETIKAITGFEGRIDWDTTKPDGQLRKRLDLTRMREFFPDFVPTSLMRGLGNTIRWAEERLCR